MQRGRAEAGQYALAVESHHTKGFLGFPLAHRESLSAMVLLSTRAAVPCCPLQRWFRGRKKDRQSKACLRTAIYHAKTFPMEGFKTATGNVAPGEGGGCNLRHGPSSYGRCEAQEHRQPWRNTPREAPVRTVWDSFPDVGQVRSPQGVCLPSSDVITCNNFPASKSASVPPSLASFPKKYYFGKEVSYTTCKSLQGNASTQCKSQAVPAGLLSTVTIKVKASGLQRRA